MVGGVGFATMSLMGDLRDIADKIDPSLLPSSHETTALLGALIYRVEHGAQFVQDVAEKERQEVSDFISEAEQAATGDKPTEPAIDSQGHTATSSKPADKPAAGFYPKQIGPGPPTEPPAPIPAFAGTGVPAALEPSPASPVSPAPESSSAPESVSGLQAQIADLQAQLAAREATSQQTVVDHNTGAS